MVTRIPRLAFAIPALALLLAFPAAAAAQITAEIPFDRQGEPGAMTVTQTDPLNPTQTVTVTVPTGAFINPCTFEYVDILGTSVVSSSQSIDKFGFLKVNVGIVTKGSGVGHLDDDGDLTNGGYTEVLSGSNYSFLETQSFNFKIPVATLSTSAFTSDFIDKISMKGARSIDNWVIRVVFRVKVSNGEVKVFLVRMNDANVCKG